MLTNEILGGVVNRNGDGIALVGNTDKSDEIVGSPVEFKSGPDSNIKIHTHGSTLEIDVYYV